MKIDPNAPLEGVTGAPTATENLNDEKAQRQAEARRKSTALIKAAHPARDDHPYLVRKQVTPVPNLWETSLMTLQETLGYRPRSGQETLVGRVLIAPVTDGEAVSTCELIDENGLKSAIFGGQKAGCFWASSKLPEPTGVAQTVLIAEGVATAISASEATGLTSIAVLSCEGFGSVLRKLRGMYPTGTLVVLSDKGNGQSKAEEAALRYRAALAVPSFPGNSTGTDFNDLRCVSGHAETGAQIKTAIAKFIEGKPASKKSDDTGVTSRHSADELALDVTSTSTLGGTDGTSSTSEIEYISIPGTERPCYQVLERRSKVREEGSVLKPGVWHFSYKPATERAPETFSHSWICSPLHVLAVTRDSQDRNYGRLLRFKNTGGNWRRWAMPMECVSGSGQRFQRHLYNMGVEIPVDGRPTVAQFITEQHPDQQVKCTTQVGWCDENFVLPDKVFGPEPQNVIYQTENEASDEYTTGGDFDDWKKGVSEVAIDNPTLMLGISVAFAGPLLKLCNAENGGIHFVGDSSTGKTTIIQAACSVWGGANYRRSWRATSNGLEGAAQLFNDNMLALDEISECDPSEIGNIIYCIANGRGKQRAGRNGAAQSVSQWRCVVLSSGERSVDTSLAEGGKQIKAGQEVRLLSVPVNRTHGAWDCLHSFDGGSAMSDALKTTALEHYGHAGPRFLECLCQDERDFCQQLDVIKRSMVCTAEKLSEQEKRAVHRYALFALAGEIASEYEITGWEAGAPTEAAIESFETWRAGRGQGNSEQQQIFARVREFIERHGDSRFSAKSSAEGVKVINRAGWWEDKDGERVYLFLNTGLREAIAGNDFNRCLDALQDGNALDAPSAGERARSTRIPNRGPVKVYRIKSSALDNH